MTDSAYRVERFGKEKQPIAIIDNFCSDPAALLDTASTLVFKPLGPFYPGIRAAANPQYLSARGELLTKVLSEVFEFKCPAQLTECAYSLVTTAPKDLMPIQCLPHYDGLAPQRLALLHYMSGPETGGTAFYRHNATGFETITEARFQHYKQALTSEAEANGLPPKDYFRRENSRAETAQFTKIGTIGAKLNRLVIYRGITLHSGDIPTDLPFYTDPRKGRLTINSFLHEEERT